MDTFFKTLPILLLVTASSTINAQLQQPINTAPSTPPLLKTSDFPNIFSAQPSPNPNIGVNGRGIFTGDPLASRRGPTVTLHSYPWLTYNKLVNADDKSGRTLVYNEDTSFTLPSQPLSSSIQHLPSIPSIPGIPNPPKLPNFPTFPTPETLRKPRSIITPQINQTQFPGIAQFGNTFPSHPYPQFPISPFPYPIPYTIITQVIPVWPVFVAPYQPPPMPMVSGEGSAEVVTPETETGGEFSAGAEIAAPYPDPVLPESEAAGEFVSEAMTEGPYPDPVLPEVSGEAIGEATLAPYPAASPESEGEASGEATQAGPYPPAVSGEASGSAAIVGPYPAPVVSGEASGSAAIEGPYPAPVVSGEASGSAAIKGPYPAPVVSGEASGSAAIEGPYPAPVVSGEASGGATIDGPYPAAIKPKVYSEKSGPYPAYRPVVSGEASGSATIKGPYPAATPVKTYKARVPRPTPARPTFSGGAIQQVARPVAVKPADENLTGTLKDFILMKEFMAAKKPVPVSGGSGEKRKGPYLIPKKPEAKPEPVSGGSGEKRKGPYLIPKKPEAKPDAEEDLGSLSKPVPPTARKGDRVSYAARLREVVYPEYLRDASGRIVRFN